LLDPDLATFIHALAQRNPGLLVITSREHLPSLVGEARRDLEDLARDTAVALLRQLQITGTDAELAAVCERFGCHDLSLDLVGRFLVRFHRNDIRRVDCIRDLHEADTETRDLRQRTAWRVLETYETWLARAQGADDPRELALLRLTGLFDRPAGADLLAALRAPLGGSYGAPASGRHPAPPSTRTDWPRPTRSQPALMWSGGRPRCSSGESRPTRSSTSPSTT
jgi:hypothetical protein